MRQTAQVLSEEVGQAQRYLERAQGDAAAQVLPAGAQLKLPEG
jgi:hypothetical protein